MSGPGAARVHSLAEQLSDRRPVDWDSAEAAADAKEKELVRALRLLDRVAAAHGSGGAAGAAGPRPSRPELRRWAHLEILEKVGEGGFAEVFRARDPLLDREVALKLLLPRRDQAEAAQQAILREGRLLARIKHPNVATVYGADRIQGRIGIWMEYISGETLARLTRRHGPFAASEAMLMGLRLCDALSALHAGGLVHRDVKAQNVMRETGGRIVLMDFGVARDLKRAAERESTIPGTPLYMAPEVLRGEPAAASSDLFSLGVLIYHLVTGDFPRAARALEEAPQGSGSDLRSELRDRRPGLPEEFYALVERALAESPRERFASAGEMSRALSGALARFSDAPYATRLSPAPGGVLEESATASAPHRRVAAGAATGGAGRRRPILWAVAALIATALGFEALRTAPAPGPAVSRLAVAPFVNVSGEQAEDYLASAVPIELIARLGQVGDLTVVPWSFTRRYLDDPRTVDEIAAATGADAVVEGSVHLRPRAAGDTGPAQVSVRVQVFQARSGALLWSLRARGHMGEFLAMQERLARELATRLRARIARRAQLVTTTEAASPQAVERYLRGGEALEERTPEALAAAVAHFRDAVELDPAFAEAHVGLAEAVTLLSLFTGSPPSEEALRLALAATGRALDIEDDNGRGWAARAFAHYVFAWDWEEAGAGFRRALALAPNAPLAHHWYADYLSALGRHEDALRHARIAAERSPASPIMSRDVAWVHFFARRYDEAIAQLDDTLRLEPDFPPARTLLARAFVMQKRYRQALEELAKVEGYGLLRAQALAAAGRRQEALALLGELSRAAPTRELRSPYMRAQVMVALGETEAALAALDEALARRDPGLVSLRTDPMVDGLRGDPRFERLLDRLGFPERGPGSSGGGDDGEEEEEG